MHKLSIDVTLIDKSRIREVTRKNGAKAKFLDLVLMDRPDAYGNSGFAIQNTTREERESGTQLPILGNWSTPQPREEQPVPAKATPVPVPSAANMAEDDIPF